MGTLTGTVSDAYGNLVGGAKVSYTLSNLPTTTVSTDAAGKYAVAYPPGPHDVTFSATGYVPFSQSVEVKPATSLTLNVRLNPSDRVAVNVAASPSSGATMGSSVVLTPSVSVFDPALKGQPITYAWSLVSGPAPTFDSQTAATVTMTLANAAAFKTALAELAVPPYKVNPDEAPVNIDRYQVLPLSYEQALSQGNTTKVKLVVTIGGVQFSTTVPVAAALPYVQSTGLANVPVNKPVILQGQFPFRDAGGNLVFPAKPSWSWSVTGPSGAVALNDAATPYPDFVPTAPGAYVVTEGGVQRFSVYAGTYGGVMSGPGVASASCTGCHSPSGGASDNFTPWLATGHKDVIWAGIRELPPGGHYAASCTPCHTAGNGLTGSNGYADQIAAVPPDFATTLQGNALAELLYWQLYPNSAPFAGVQCENCHGPQIGSGRHHQDQALYGVGTARISYSSNTCATCHARAPRHGRYPQWLLSGHASMATFTFNSTLSGASAGQMSNGCACCHSAQGYAAYRAILPTANGDRSQTVLPAGLSVYNAQPISCPTCHVSHSEGDAGKVEWTSLAKVGPSEGSTYMLPSGFAAEGVGKGALCISCHNSRQGFRSGGPHLHEDGDGAFGTLTSYSAPHEACQGDVLLGRNAYWLGAASYDSPSTRSKHSYITDTCVTCHMVLTTLDPALSSAGQTRHDFKATPDVCNQCHTAYSTESVQAAFSDRLLDLRRAAGLAILKLKYNGAIPAGTSAILIANRSGQVDVTSGGVTSRWFINDKAGQDAFLGDPNKGGALVQGCVAGAIVDTVQTYDCTGFLNGAPGYTGAELDPSLSATSVTAAGVNGSVAKALWNAVLVQDDASKAVHNASFTFQVIDNTILNVSVFAK